MQDYISIARPKDEESGLTVEGRVSNINLNPLQGTIGFDYQEHYFRKNGEAHSKGERTNKQVNINRNEDDKTPEVEKFFEAITKLVSKFVESKI